jgi:hypothetical protein
MRSSKLNMTRGEHSHGDGTTRWRRMQLLRAGFDPDLATCLATDDAIDLHALIELVERGCRPDLAARILAPLERE